MFVLPRPLPRRFLHLFGRHIRGSYSLLCVRRHCYSRSVAFLRCLAAASPAPTRATLAAAAAFAAAPATMGMVTMYFTRPMRCSRCGIQRSHTTSSSALPPFHPAPPPLPQAIGRLLHRAFGLIDLAPSDVFAGLVLVRSRQKSAVPTPQDGTQYGAAGAVTDAGSEEVEVGGAAKDHRPRGASSEGLLFVRSRRWGYATRLAFLPPCTRPTIPYAPHLPLSWHPSPDDAGGLPFSPDSAADRLALAEAARLMRFAFGVYGAHRSRGSGVAVHPRWPWGEPRSRPGPALAHPRMTPAGRSTPCLHQAGPPSCLPTPAADAAAWRTRGAEVRG